MGQPVELLYTTSVFFSKPPDHLKFFMMFCFSDCRITFGLCIEHRMSAESLKPFGLSHSFPCLFTSCNHVSYKPGPQSPSFRIYFKRRKKIALDEEFNDYFLIKSNVNYVLAFVIVLTFKQTKILLYYKSELSVFPCLLFEMCLKLLK